MQGRVWKAVLLPVCLDSYRVLRGEQSQSSIRRRGECSWEQAGLGQTSSREVVCVCVWGGVQGPGSLSPSRCLLCARPVLRLCVDCTDWDVSQGTWHPWELAFASPILHMRNLELCWISTLWGSLSMTAETAWDLRSVLTQILFINYMKGTETGKEKSPTCWFIP